MNKIWKIKSSAQTEKIEEIINILLKNRGLITKKELNDFLNPKDPYNISANEIGINKEELNKAIKRIKKAISHKENIIVYGDYDADGICATALIWETLHALKANVLPFIPNREEHGYGLNEKGIKSLLITYRPADLPTLIITVDNGIVAHSGVNYANKLGIDVILTDHHQKKLNTKYKILNTKYDLPKAHAIIWSDKVCGAGVAWFLAKEIYHHFHNNLQGFKASNALELACIGTITDLMPVMAINRSIIKFGLRELNKSKRIGLQAICKESNINQGEINTYEIGYIIGPRLNAMGRLEDALESLRLLCTQNLDKANNLAAKLGLTNRERQQLTQTTFEHALERSKIYDLRSRKLIFLAHESYNQGIIGLVAGKLADLYYRPAIVIAKGKTFSKASVRSINGFNIIEALRNFEDLYEDLGGHPMAAGFTIKTNKIDELQHKLEKYFHKKISNDLLQPKINIDLEIDLKNVDLVLEKALQKLNPFGMGNPRPTFCSRNIKVIDSRFVGRNSQHLKLRLQSQDNQSAIFDAIGFNLSKNIKPISRLELIDICFNMDINEWNGNKNLQLIIRDIKKA